jgi:tetratricopeptide (TPR) repeat protein
MDDLETAKRFFYSGRFAKADELLRNCINNGLRNIEIFKYMGLTGLYLGDPENARRALERAEKVMDADPEVLNGLAYLHLKNKDLQSAVDLWLNILEKKPSFRIARHNLDRVRNARDTEKLADKASPRQYLGPAGIAIDLPWKPMAVVAGVVAVAVLLIFFISNLPPSQEKENRHKISASSVRLPKTDDYIVSSSVDSMYRFQNSEVKPLFALCKRYIKRKNINAAVVLINKVLHSNLRDDVKQQFQGLKEFIPEPSDYRSIRSHIRFSELFNDPTVNEGVYLVLSGRDRQLKSDSSGTDFLMTVSDDSGENVESAVFTSRHFEGLRYGVQVTVLCRFKSVITIKGRIRVEGLKIWMEKKQLMEMKGR